MEIVRQTPCYRLSAWAFNLWFSIVVGIPTKAVKYLLDFPLGDMMGAPKPVSESRQPEFSAVTPVRTRDPNRRRTGVDALSPTLPASSIALSPSPAKSAVSRSSSERSAARASLRRTQKFPVSLLRAAVESSASSPTSAESAAPASQPLSPMSLPSIPDRETPAEQPKLDLGSSSSPKTSTTDSLSSSTAAGSTDRRGSTGRSRSPVMSISRARAIQAQLAQVNSANGRAVSPIPGLEVSASSSSTSSASAARQSVSTKAVIKAVDNLLSGGYQRRQELSKVLEALGVSPSEFKKFREIQKAYLMLGVFDDISSAPGSQPDAGVLARAGVTPMEAEKYKRAATAVQATLPSEEKVPDAGSDEAPEPPPKHLDPIQLIDVLNTACGLQSFSRHCAAEFSDENLQFWLECSKFQMAFGDTDEMDRYKNCKRLVETYCKKGAEMQVNLSDAVLSEVVRNFTNGDIDANLFEKARKEIYKLMQNDSYNRYKGTVAYRKARPEICREMANSLRRFNP